MSYFQISKDEKRLQDAALAQLEFSALLEIIAKYCMSESGKDLVSQLEPSSNLEFLQREHSIIEEYTNVLSAEDTIPFEGMNDVRQKLQKSQVTNAVLLSGELLKINDLMRISRLTKSFFAPKQEKYPLIWDDAQFLHENRLLEKHISEAIDDNGEVKDSASRELFRIRREIIEKSNRLRSRLEKLLAKAAKDDYAAEEYVSIRDGRYVIPVKAEHKRHIPGIIHNVSQTGSTVFLEPSETFEMNNEISMLMSEEKREIYRILQNLTKEVGEDAAEFLRSYDILAGIDSYLARAKYALEYGGIKPDISEDNEIYLKDARHPLLCKSKGRKNVIPLSSTFDDEKRGQLISGPNAGGKTVALKSVGINVAMALSGIFPLGICKTNYRIIFSSIGDHQSIENDLSTFSSQILQLKNIVDNASPKSLILIDEICSGTDPYEGSALAAGILDTFLALKSFFIVTTHQSSLKTYSLNREEIQNASLEFDEEKLKPTYKYLLGIPGNSYAFVLAKNLGMNRLVLERAHNYIGDGHSELEKSISLLQKYRQEAEQLKLKAQQEKQKAERAKQDYEIRLKEIKLRKKELIENAHKDALDVLNNANSLIEKTIKEIREEKKAINEIKTDFNHNKTKLENKVRKADKEIKNIPSNEEFKVGDVVTIEDSDSSFGSIIMIDDKAKMALVDFNGVKFRMPLKQLIKSKKKNLEKSKSLDYIRFDAKTRIDLRGKRADESIREIDELINDALVSNVNQLTIVHGKGTGALRHAIHQYLSEHPSVVDFRNGALVEGGDGVTIVDL
jgi:DNA mismatch repair protein MutS2